MKHFIQNALAAKKLYLFALGLLLSIVGIQRANAANEIYAALSGSTMTIYYDDQKASRHGVLTAWTTEDGMRNVPDATRETITKAVINSSMVDALPTSTNSWFRSLSNLTTIDGLANLNTSEVTNMEAMFAYCSSLTSLDVSHFKTANVTNMASMFYECKSLHSLDLSSFNTAKVTSMSAMFFSCIGLTSLDVSGFTISSNTSTSYMFSTCRSLKTIYCDNEWNPRTSNDMFKDCTSLVGWKGTKYDAGKTDKTYARPDMHGPGYFTPITPFISTYVEFKDGVLTYYYDDQILSRTGVVAEYYRECYDGSLWSVLGSITKAVISPSMADAPLTSMRHLFNPQKYNSSETGSFYKMTAIEGLENLNTSIVRDMAYMFSTCPSLTELDLSHFNTANVTNMSYMFWGCSSLTSLDVSKFNTANVANMGYMFQGCSSLKTIYCDNEWNPSTSYDMFEGCTSLVGGMGTKYDAGKTDKTYARPDGLDDQPGYFTEAGVTWNLTGGVLTISGTGPMEDYASKNDVPWYTDRKSVVSVIIKDGVTIIGKNAFFDCINMTSAQIGKGVTKINNYAFKNCSSLSAVAIPRNVTNIGKEAFINCSGLTEITCQATTPPTCGNYAFDGVTNTIPVYVPAGSVDAYRTADDWNYFSNIQAMAPSVDWDLTDGVLTIFGAGPMEDYGYEKAPWFSQHASITSVIIEDGITTIGECAFVNCGNIHSVTIPNSVTSIHGGAFSWCTGLLAVTIPENVESIGNFAFKKCEKLESITIPHNVTNIGNEAFSDCSSLTELTCEAITPPTCGNYAFEGVTNTIPVYVPAESVAAYRTADGWNYFTNITIPLTPEEQVEVNKVIDLINAIFDAPITLDSEAAITAARNAYDALSSLLQTAVINYDLLQDAEKTLAALKANIPTVKDNWVFYDNGVYNTRYAYDGNESWGIRIPANTTSKKSIFRINTYIGVAGEYEVEIYAGGATPAEGTKLYSEVVNMPDAKAFNEADLANPVPIDPTQDIWVVMKNINGYSDPMTACDITGAVNACWFNLDGTWKTTADLGITNVAWMIRVFFATYTGQALIDGIRYYLNGDDMTAEVMTLADGYYAGDIVLPEKVSYLKNDYAVTSVAGGAFRNCPELLTVTIPKSVNWIEPEAFFDSPKLTAVNVAAANANYSSLDGVLFNKAQTELRAYPIGKEGAYIVPEGVETIMDKAFAGNTHLTAVTLPASLYEIASHAFENCTGLEMITCRATNVPYLGGDVFVGVNKAIPVFVPKANIALYKAEDEWKDFTNYIAIEDKEAADAVIAKINAIGTVTYTPECKARIDAARGGYDALTAEQKVYITDATYKILTDAEQAYADLKAKAEADQAAANAVIAKINAIGTVTLESEAAILDARSAYNALTAAQQGLVTNYSVLTAAEAKLEILKKQAESDEAAAKAVTDLINGIGTVTYTSESKARIDAAREAYDALTDAQKALVTNLTTLTAAEKAYADLKAKAEADQAAANAVIAKINAIGTVSYTPESKALIDAAREAYDALTDAQKGLVSSATYKILTDAEQTYADLKKKADADQAAANIVIGKINAIGTVTLSSEAAILDARSAYDALTADQKALVTNLSTLTAAEAALDQLKKQAAADQAAANIVISKISAIGTVEYTTESKARIDAAREAYDGLTAAQKVLVTNYGVLTAAEKAYADLKAKAEADQAAANAVIVKIDAIGDVTLASEPAIVAARSAYDALTAAQKLLVTNLSTLTAAEAKLEILKKQAEGDEAAANAVTGLISAIGTVEYTSESKARIDAAREAYDALTAVQQGLVTNYGVLTAAEQAYADLKKKADADQAAAKAVIAKIDAIGTVTLSSEAAITAARSAYDALTPAQQALVTNYGTLLSAETTLELLKHQAETDQAAANAVIAKIDAIGTVTLESEAAILDARSAYGALTATQKLLVTNLGVLTAAEKKLAELKANAEAVENAKLQLKTIVSQANELKMVAMLYAPTAVSDIDAIINDAQSTIDDPNATVDQINAKAATLTDNLNTLEVNLLEQAKEQLKQSIRDLYQPGDYPSWYASAIIPALDQVDGITWDFNKSVQDNILYFQVTGQNLYNATKAALEALRGTDKRSIISSCAFTGFENGIKADMTWNIKALNALVANLNASVAAEPYHLDAEMSSLGKWDPVNEELVILDPYEAQKLTAGDYQFITAVKIDGKDAKQYRLPKATEEVLSVTVDAAVWSVDLSGIVIDANYSYTYVTSPMFTISKSEDVELIEIEPVKTQKIFHNGHFYILRGEHIYDLQGTLVR